MYGLHRKSLLQAQLGAVEFTSLCCLTDKEKVQIHLYTSIQAEKTKDPSEMQRQRGKRGRKEMKSGRPAVDTASVPNKGLFVLFAFLFVI